MIRRWRRFWQDSSTANKMMIVIGAVLLSFIVADYYSQSRSFSWVGVSDYIKPTGVDQRGKTMWDWLDLLIVPVALALAAYYLNRAEREAERKVADKRAEVEREIAEKRAEAEREAAADRARETALQTYLDRMTDLLLKEDLRSSREEDEVRVVARARTLTTLRELDGERKGTLVKFLHEARLISVNGYVIDLQSADLSKADLRGANLSAIDLREAILSKADLSEAILSEAILSEAILSEAILSGAILSGAYLDGAILRSADLRGAILRGANLTGAELSAADLFWADLSAATLTGAHSTKSTIWPKEDFNPTAAGVIVEAEEAEAPQ